MADPETGRGDIGRFGDGVAIGSGVARTLGVGLGDEVRLISPDGVRTAFGISPRVKAYEVTYIFTAGRWDIDRSRVYMPFAEAQPYFNREGVADELEVIVEDPESVERLTGPIRAAAGQGARVWTWLDASGSFLRALEIEDNVMFVILSVLVLIAAMNIVSGLIMLVKNKGRDIGILRTMGLTEGAVLRVFFICGAFTGLIGTAAGVLLGCLFAIYIDPIFAAVNYLSGGGVWDPSIRGIYALPAKLQLAMSPRRWGFRWGCPSSSPISLRAGPRGSTRSRRCAMSEATAAALRLSGIEKTYNAGRPNEIRVLRGAELALSRGEAVALVAPSGAGKSTLLHIAGLLDTPDAGTVEIAGEAMQGRSDRRRTAARRGQVGFVYQFHHLLPEFSALENVMLPQLAHGAERRAAEARARGLLDSVGVAARADHRPAALSGGEQQRVAFCRAMANAPRVLLADEPTGNLDPETSDRVFDALMHLVRQTGLSALIATHNRALAGRMDRVLRMDQGRLAPDGAPAA